MSGFEEVEAIARDLARDMTKLLQPAPTFAGLFRLLLAAVSDPKDGASKFWRLLGVAAAVWRGPLKIGGGVVLAGLILALVSSDAGWLFFGALAGPLATAALVGLDLHRLIFKALGEHRFGMLPGLRQPGGEGPGLTDWLADKIDIVAGNLESDGRPGAPLTVGQLEEAGVEIAAMTTDLTSQRPYQLPLRSADHFFSRAEFEALFPARVVAHLVGEATPLDARHAGGPSDLYPMRIGADFPVLLVARLSLSFPGLIQAIPFWRRDWQLKTEAGDAGLWRCCVFSDGGISSNLPVHLFDAWLPRRPTFAISLTAWDRRRHGDERVHLPKTSTQSTNLPTLELRRVGAFLFAILNAAKDWQDTLQRNLPGFAERTVEIRLDETKEGGMNLTMDREVIEKLGELGREAGRRLVADFDLDENRWRRAMSVLPEIESGLEAFAEAWREAPVGTAAMPYETLLTDYDQKTITAATRTWRRETLAPFARRLAELGGDVASARADPVRETVQDGPRPGQDASMRLLADADRRPRSRQGAGSGADM